MTRPRILEQNPSPQGENSVIVLRKIRKTSFFGGRVMTLPYGVLPNVLRQSETPVSEETGVFPLKMFVPIRRAGTSDWSGGFTRLPSSNPHQARVWLPALPGDRSGGFTRLPSSKTHQARVCPGPSPVRRADHSDQSRGPNGLI